MKRHHLNEECEMMIIDELVEDDEIVYYLLDLIYRELGVVPIKEWLEKRGY